LGEESTPGQYLVETGVVLKAMEDYAYRTTQIIHQNRTELLGVAGILAKTVKSVAGDTGDGVPRLQQLVGELGCAVQIEDVRLLRMKLADCLAAVEEEAAKRREQQEQEIQALRKQSPPPDTQRGSKKKDAVTGLGDRATAESELNEAIRTQRKAFAAVMVLDRVRNYNAAFGYEVGDQVLKRFAAFISGRMRPGCQLFRWTGPAFMLLMARANQAETVREEISALMAQHFEHHVQTGTRSIRLPVKCRWTLLPMMAAPRLLMQRIDTFVATPQNAEL
jgi:diguanylate cyclase (GGDEF)-like protein